MPWSLKKELVGHVVHAPADALDHWPAAQTRHCSTALCSAALAPSSARNVPGIQSTQRAKAWAGACLPAGHTVHLSSVLCSTEARASSVKYVPATQSVQVSADTAAHFPAAQTVHLPLWSCATATVPGSLKYVPGLQSTHRGAATLLHFPAAQIAHATVDAGDAVPAVHAVQEVAPVPVKVSVAAPALQVVHEVPVNAFAAWYWPLSHASHTGVVLAVHVPINLYPALHDVTHVSQVVLVDAFAG